jgi:two-component sensor histidine kinase
LKVEHLIKNIYIVFSEKEKYRAAKRSCKTASKELIAVMSEAQKRVKEIPASKELISALKSTSASLAGTDVSEDLAGVMRSASQQLRMALSAIKNL